QRLFNDVIVIAFSCDTSRIAVCPEPGTMSAYTGDYHQDVAHRSGHDEPFPSEAPDLQNVYAQALTVTTHQAFFEGIYLDLVAKLAPLADGAGGTVLDSCRVTWTQESGIYTHTAIDMPVVMAGGAAGRMRTGSHVDYRDMSHLVTEATGSLMPYPRYPDADTP